MKGLTEDRREEISFSSPMFMCLCRDRQRNSVATFTRIWGTINDATQYHRILMLFLLERERLLGRFKDDGRPHPLCWLIMADVSVCI